MKAADANLNILSAKLTAYVHCSRELIGLYAGQDHQATTAGFPYPSDQLLNFDASIGFIVSAQMNLNILTEDMSFGAVLSQTIQGCKSVRWN